MRPCSLQGEVLTEEHWRAAQAKAKRVWIAVGLGGRHHQDMDAGVTLLVVEDQESDYHFVELALKESRFPTRVRWVRDGVEATQYLMGQGTFADREEHPLPDIILIDLTMPRMSGHELLAWFRDHPEHRVIPTLVMSSSDRKSDIDRAYELGATTYFVKPIRFETFVDLCKHIAGYWTYGMTSRRLAGREGLRRAV